VLMHDQAPFYLIAHSVVYMPMRKDVQGYVMSPLGAHQFDNVDLK
jgi:dipeptide transport system substrate-binding protein